MLRFLEAITLVTGEVYTEFVINSYSVDVKVNTGGER